MTPFWLTVYVLMWPVIVAGVLAFIVASMLIVVLTIGLFGPRTRNRALEDIAR